MFLIVNKYWHARKKCLTLNWEQFDIRVELYKVVSDALHLRLNFFVTGHKSCISWQCLFFFQAVNINTKHVSDSEHFHTNTKPPSFSLPGMASTQKQTIFKCRQNLIFFKFTNVTFGFKILYVVNKVYILDGMHINYHRLGDLAGRKCLPGYLRGRLLQALPHWYDEIGSDFELCLMRSQTQSFIRRNISHYLSCWYGSSLSK